MNLFIRRIVLCVTSAIGAFVGVWAAFVPQSFYDSFPGFGLGPWVGIDGPFNEHLVRDVGALYLALAAGGAYAAITRSIHASRVVGIAWVIFSVPHLGYHLQHLAGLTPGDAVAEVLALGSTVVLGVVLLVGSRKTEKGVAR